MDATSVSESDTIRQAYEEACGRAKKPEPAPARMAYSPLTLLNARAGLAMGSPTDVKPADMAYANAADLEAITTQANHDEMMKAAWPEPPYDLIGDMRRAGNDPRMGLGEATAVS